MTPTVATLVLMAQVLEDEGQLSKGEGGPVFSPALYKQRYEAVLTIARSVDPPPKKVVPTHTCNTSTKPCPPHLLLRWWTMGVLSASSCGCLRRKTTLKSWWVWILTPSL